MTLHSSLCLRGMRTQRRMNAKQALELSNAIRTIVEYMQQEGQHVFDDSVCAQIEQATYILDEEVSEYYRLEFESRDQE